MLIEIIISSSISYSNNVNKQYLQIQDYQYNKNVVEKIEETKENKNEFPNDNPAPFAARLDWLDKKIIKSKEINNYNPYFSKLNKPYSRNGSTIGSKYQTRMFGRDPKFEPRIDKK